MQHPTDPPRPHRAASVLGRLASAGLIAPHEAEIALAAAAQEAAGADRAGLQARLLHTLHSHTGHAHLPPLIGEAQRQEPLHAIRAALPPGPAIPPRAWLYGAFLVRGFVSVLAAPGGVGKSAYALAIALAVTTGRPLLGDRVHRAAPTWVLNLEDPMDELDRRVAALCLAHRIDPATLGGLYLHSGRTRPLVMAGFDRLTSRFTYPDKDHVAAAIRAAGIGLVIVDPLVKSHTLDENDNRHMDALATVWSEVADATGAAILLVHHVRKGAVNSDIDAARGAKSLTDAARAAALLAPMTDDEARLLGIPASDSWRFLRRDDAKANLAPRAARAQWLRLETIALGNASEDYPEGDRVGAITAWRETSALAAISPAECNIALDLIAAGPEPGARYGLTRNPRFLARWAGHVLTQCFDLEDREALQIIGIWLRSGLLVEGEYFDRPQRKTRRGVSVDDSKRPTVTPSPNDPAPGDPA